MKGIYMKNKSRQGLIVIFFLFLFLVSSNLFNDLSAYTQKKGRIKRVVVLPYEGNVAEQENQCRQILPDRMNLFFNLTPGFLAVIPPDNMPVINLKDLGSRDIPEKLLNKLRKYHIDYLLTGYIGKDSVDYYLLNIEKGNISKFEVKTTSPFDFHVLEKLISLLQEKIGKDSLSNTTIEKNIDLIKYKSTASYKEFLLASKLMDEGKGPEKVMPHIEKSLEADPDFLSSKSLYARCLVKMGDFSRAGIMYDNILLKAPGFLPAVIGKGIMLIAREEDRLASKFFENALKKMPGNIILMYNRAYSLERSGDAGEAEVIYKEILRIDPFNQIAQYNLGMLFLKTGKFEKSLGMFLKLGDENPGNTLYAYNISSVYLHMGKLEKAQKKLIEITKSGDFKEVYNDLGIISRKTGRFDEAEKYFKKALEIDPEYSSAYNNLGVLYRLQNKNKLAKENYHMAIQYNIRNPEALYNLGLLALSERDLDLAWLYFNRSIDMSPGFIQAYINLAITQMYRGNIEDAEKILLGLEKKNPRNPLILYNLGVLYKSIGKNKRALKYFAKTLEAEPQFADAHNNMGVIYLVGGKIKDAESQLDRAIDISPGNSIYLFNRGLTSYYGSDMNNAEKYFEKALEADPIFLKARRQLARAYLRNGKYEKAEKQIGIILKEKPDDYQAQYLKAVYYERTGQIIKAAGTLEDMVDRMKYYLEGYGRLGILYIKLQKYEKAEKIYQKLVKTDPEDCTSLINLGIAQRMLKKNKKAEESFKRAIRVSRGRKEGYRHLGIFYIENKDFKKAVKLYKEAVRKFPRDIDFLSNLSLSLSMEGKYGQSLNVMKSAVKVSPGNSLLYYRTAFVYALMDRKEMVIENLKKAIKLDPELKDYAAKDPDFKKYWKDSEFIKITSESGD
ncbi:MAG: tetratricopeptide repeat protein [Candidatus Eremiobacteraeota bacterium]|nr:tetratricopeptide repeat protein [Candidatus Eremiobacteraeota bacterium]